MVDTTSEAHIKVVVEGEERITRLEQRLAAVNRDANRISSGGGFAPVKASAGLADPATLARILNNMGIKPPQAATAARPGPAQAAAAAAAIPASIVSAATTGLATRMAAIMPAAAQTATAAVMPAVRNILAPAVMAPVSVFRVAAVRMGETMFAMTGAAGRLAASFPPVALAVTAVGAAFTGLAVPLLQVIAGVKMLTLTFEGAQEAAKQAIHVRAAARRYYPGASGPALHAAEEAIETSMETLSSLIGESALGLQERVNKRLRDVRLGKGAFGDKEIFERWGISPETRRQFETQMQGGKRLDLTDWTRQWIKMRESLEGQFNAAPEGSFARNKARRGLAQLGDDTAVMFGPKLSEIIRAFSSEQFKALEEGIRASQKLGETNADTATEAINLTIATQKLNASYDNLWKGIYRDTTPAITEFMDLLNNRLLGGLGKNLRELGSAISRNAWQTLTELLKNFAPTITELTAKIKESNPADTAKAIEEFATGVKNLGSAIWDTLKAINALIDAFKWLYPFIRMIASGGLSAPPDIGKKMGANGVDPATWSASQWGFQLGQKARGAIFGPPSGGAPVKGSMLPDWLGSAAAQPLSVQEMTRQRALNSGRAAVEAVDPNARVGGAFDALNPPAAPAAPSGLSPIAYTPGGGLSLGRAGLPTRVGGGRHGIYTGDTGEPAGAPPALPSGAQAYSWPAAPGAAPGAAAGAPGAGAAAGGELNREAYDRMFKGTPLAGQYEKVVEAAQQNNVPPSLMAGILAHETGRGTSKMLQDRNNPAGLMDPQTNWQTGQTFRTIGEGIDAAGRTIGKNYQRGGQTIEGMAGIYAPPGARNDPRGQNQYWPSGVSKYQQELQGAGADVAAAPPGGRTTGALALDDALRLQGKNENYDRADIQEYLRTGGVNMNPAKQAWCAATINAGLGRTGGKGTGSQVARSYLKWGTSVQGAPQYGDVLVQHKGNFNPNATGGHVGFATGKTRGEGENLQYQMYSGNTGDKAGYGWYSPNQVTVRRGPVAEGQGGTTASGSITDPTAPRASGAVPYADMSQQIGAGSGNAIDARKMGGDFGAAAAERFRNDVDGVKVPIDTADTSRGVPPRSAPKPTGGDTAVDA